MAYRIAPSVPECVRNVLKGYYAIQRGEEMRFEEYDEDMIDFETKMVAEVNRGTFFDNIGKLI